MLCLFWESLKNNDESQVNYILENIEDPFWDNLVSNFGWHRSNKALLEAAGLMDRYDRLPMVHLEERDFQTVKEFFKSHEQYFLNPLEAMIYAFVPARAGSTRLVDKNFLILNNTRLFEWSINTANESKGVDKIIFSSDSNKYIEYANSINLNKDLIIDKRSKGEFNKEYKNIRLPKGRFFKK